MLPTVTGEFRAGADPTLRFAPSGVAVSELRAVASSRKKDEDGKWVDDKSVWVTITTFRQLAENVAETITKGDLVVVSGKLQVEEWEDKDGAKRTSVKVIADHIGPALAYATAKVSKTERRESGGSQQQTPQGQDHGDPWAAPASTTQTEEPPF